MAGSTFPALNFPPHYHLPRNHPSKKFYPVRFTLFPLTRSSKQHQLTHLIKPLNSLPNPSIDSLSPDLDDSISPEFDDSSSPEFDDSVSSEFDLVSSTEHSDGSVIFKFGNAAEMITETVVSIDEIEEMPRYENSVELVDTTVSKNNGSSVVSETEDVNEANYDEGCCEETDKEEVMVMSNAVEVVDEGLIDEVDNGVESILVDEKLSEESVASGISEPVVNNLELSYVSVEDNTGITQDEGTRVNSSVDVEQIQEEKAEDFTTVVGGNGPSEEAVNRFNSTEIVEVVEEVSTQIQEESASAVISGLEPSFDSVEGDIEKNSSDVMEVNGSVDVDQTKEKETNEFTRVIGKDDPSVESSRQSSSTKLVEVVGEISPHALEKHDGISTLESSKKMEDILSLPHTENNDQATNTTLEMTDSKQIGSQDVETSIDINSEEKEMSRLRLTISSGATMLPHPSKALTGGEDAYFVACQNWFGVADGAGQWSLEGNNAGIYARELMENSAKVVLENERDPITDPAEILVQSAAVSTSSGSSTALVAHFTGKTLHVANLGDSGFIVIRDGTIFMKSRPMFYGFNFPVQIAKGLDPSQLIERYTVDIAAGDVIICATDGLFDNLYENEIALVVSKSLESGSEPKEIAEHLAAITQEVAKSSGARSPFADAAQAAGYSGVAGGKFDDVTVIVSLVQQNIDSV